MMEKGKISNKQLIFTFLTSRLMLTMAYLSFVNAPPWNQDLWISGIVAFPLHILLVLPVFFLIKRFPNMSIIESAEAVLGFAGKLIGILYVWFFIHQTSTILREMGEFLTAALYPETPITVFIVTTTLFAAYAIIKGLETICRVGEIIAPIILASIVSVFFMVARDIDIYALTPVLEDGISACYLRWSCHIRKDNFWLVFVDALPQHKQSGENMDLHICPFFSHNAYLYSNCHCHCRCLWTRTGKGPKFSLLSPGPHHKHWKFFRKNRCLVCKLLDTRHVYPYSHSLLFCSIEHSTIFKTK